MKKFSKILAVSLALAMVFGMTVFAASPTTSNSQAALEAQAKSVSDTMNAPEGVNVKVAAASAEQRASVHAAALDTANYAAVAAAVGMPGAKITNVLLIIDIEASEQNVPLNFKVSGVKADKRYALLHMNNDGSLKEVLPATCSSDGWITATFTSYSVYAVVEVSADDAASPKTGETMPVAGYMAIVLLAGAVVCAKKAKFNR